MIFSVTQYPVSYFAFNLQSKYFIPDRQAARPVTPVGLCELWLLRDLLTRSVTAKCLCDVKQEKQENDKQPLAHKSTSEQEQVHSFQANTNDLIEAYVIEK